MKRMLLVSMLVPLFWVAGCSTMKPTDFAGTEPRLDLFAYFEGKTRAWGIFQDRSGRPRRQFTVDIVGVVEGDRLTLTEDFVYADGETQQRIWVIDRLDEHRFRGRAGDVIGHAEGLAYGQALNWRYTLALPYRDSTIEVQFDDWMFLQSDEVMVNRATVSKFGFRVGEVILFFSKVGRG